MATVGKQFQCLIIIISFSLSLSIRFEKFKKLQEYPQFKQENSNPYGLYSNNADHKDSEPKESRPLDKPDFTGLTAEEKNYIWNQYQIEKRQKKELKGEKPYETTSSSDPTLSEWDDNWDEDVEAQPKNEQDFDRLNDRFKKYGPREESAQAQLQWPNTYDQPDVWANNNGPEREQLDSERWHLPQGMSDTRSVEGGKFHYDLNNNKYNSKHPYSKFYESEDYEQQP
ncbi:hypothetical protein STAS_01024 [Striga asiatica]|uniref:Uncharacterized protein n=1 Tax=Striga asiatica TaxID=4170 RepID=A0A5A7NY82_STRAF|nr:hypothetical protein STAS_01024 [Striga asiatica]